MNENQMRRIITACVSACTVLFLLLLSFLCYQWITKAQLEKGKRIVEILKQDQYAPMRVEDQVLIIFAVSDNHTNDIPVEDIKRFEKELIEFARYRYPELLQEIKTTKNFDKELQAKVAAVVEEFKATFKAEENK